MRILLTVAILMLPLAAQAKTARCHIESDGEILLKGACRFRPGPNGTFYLDNVKRNKPLFGQTMALTANVFEPGVAEVSGLTKFGLSVRWGTFRRSRTQPACWIDDGMKICAY